MYERNRNEAGIYMKRQTMNKSREEEKEIKTNTISSMRLHISRRKFTGEGK
jgi:hypothetical protein